MESSHLRNPLAKVRGLGSAKKGVSHWWTQRLISIALIPLSIWFMVVVLTTLIEATRVEVADWIANPVVAMLMLAFTLLMIAHCKMGIQEVIEDYIHREGIKLAALITNMFVSWALAVITLFSVAKLHFIGI
jgi:succinate dehydrogenase / fumarate reductase, membrane anchor subunit